MELQTAKRKPAPGTTLAYVIVSYYTLRKIAEQAEIAVKSANAALLNAQAVINSERPWLVIKIERGTQLAGGPFQFVAVNQGRTPAEIVSCRFAFITTATDVDDVPDVPDYGPYGLMHRPFVGSSAEWRDPEMFIDIRAMLDADAALAADVRSNRRRFIVWGRVAYVDVLGEPRGSQPIRETRFCYFYSPPLDNFLPAGKLGWNLHT